VLSVRFKDAPVPVIVVPVTERAPPRVTNPVPKFTGLFVVVLIANVPAVASMTGVAEVREMFPERDSRPVALRVVNLPVLAVVPPIGVLSIVPPSIFTDVDAKLLAVTTPLPKFTGLFVNVLMDNVPAVASMTGVADVKEMLPEEVRLLDTVKIGIDTVDAPVDPE
jgi:hypothetical protein